MCTPHQCIIDKLGGLAFREAVKAGKYVFHYEKNLRKLQNEMKNLDVRRDCINIKVTEAIDGGKEIMPDVKTWQTEVDRLKTDVDQLIEQSTAKVNMHCIACSCPNIKWRYWSSKQAEQKIQDVKELTKKGHFDEISHRRPPPPELEFLCDENYVSLDSRTPIFNKIMHALEESSVNIVGVHGPGGVGKTTLVKEVCKKMLDDRKFNKVSLAVVSKDLNVKDIQSKLADSLNFDDFDATAEEKRRAAQLWRKFTNGEKYLIILDDIWEEVDLKAIGIPIMDGKTSCKVLLTSRNEGLLVNRMKVDTTFQMAELLEAEAWVVFKKRVGNSIESQPEIESLAREVCKKCKGLPVAINALGAALKDKPDYAWKDALNKLERCRLTNIQGIKPSVRASLKVSYDMLWSSDAKSCFLLCCFYREDAEIPIGDLTRHCLARRLLSQNPCTLEEVRNSVYTEIDALKSASLLSNGSHENVVRIHDVIRDVGISIAREENAFFVEHGALGWPKNLICEPSYLAISVISKKIEALPTELTCPKLHTLMFENRELSDLEVADKFFSGMTQLSVLILTRIRLRKLPSSLGKLANLRMFYLIECDLADVATLGDLNKNLEVLSLRGSSIEVLPPEIGQLTSLQVLDLEECDKLKVIPQGVISKLTNLEELYFPNTFCKWEATTDKKQDTCSSNNMSLEELRQLLTRGQLTALHIHIPDVILLPKEGLKFENLKRFRISVGSELYDLPGTRVLKYEGISLRNEFIPLVDKAEVLYLSGIKGLKKVLHDDDMEYLLGEPKSSVQSHGQNPLQSFNKLTVLLIYNCKLKYLFSTTSARGLVHLEQLEVRSCEIMEGIVGFEGRNDVNEHVVEVKFGKLKQLELKNLPNLTSFYAKKEKTRTTMGSSSAGPQPLFNEKVIFPVLERLEISEMGNLIEIWDKHSIAVLAEPGSFRQLTHVVVEDCNNLMHVFPSKMHALLKNLKVLSVTVCKNMKGIVEFEEDGLKNEVCFSKLIYLRLSGLRNLVSFCTQLGMAGTTNGNATIHAQPVFNEKVAFPALEYLTIDNVPNITEIWDKKPLPASEKETQSFCKLESIDIQNCDKLVYVFPSYILPHLQNLQTLRMLSCEEVEVIVSKEPKEKEATDNDIVVFHQLKVLDFENLPKLKSSYTGTQIFFSDKVAFPSLEKLFIRGLPKIKEVWDKQPLPEPGKEAEFFYKLSYIHVEDCHQLVYVFPSWMLPQLHHLEVLMIGDCKDLEVIVSKERKEKKVIHNDIVFPQLKDVKLWSLFNLKSYCTETQLFFSDKDAFPSLEEIELDEDLEIFRNGTSTKEECGTSDRESD